MATCTMTQMSDPAVAFIDTECVDTSYRWHFQGGKIAIEEAGSGRGGTEYFTQRKKN